MSRSYGSKVPAFCLARIKPQVRVKSPFVELPKVVTQTQEFNQVDQKLEKKDVGNSIGGGEVFRNGSQKKITSFAGRKIMIVIDTSSETNAALQWDLTHTIQTTDLGTFLYVVPSNKLGIYSFPH